MRFAKVRGEALLNSGSAWIRSTSTLRMGIPGLSNRVGRIHRLGALHALMWINS